MKRIIQVTTVLSWFNLVVGGFLVFFGSMMALSSGQVLSVVTMVVLVGSIILHSYAALKLRTSLLNPDVPLNRQTPSGIRFMGFVALFCSLMIAANAIIVLRDPKVFTDQVKLPPEAKNMNIIGLMRGTAIFTLIFAISIFVNVIINLRLLRWYQSMTYRDGSK